MSRQKNMVGPDEIYQATEHKFTSPLSRLKLTGRKTLFFLWETLNTCK